MDGSHLYQPETINLIRAGSSTIASIDRDVRMLFWDTAGVCLRALMLRKHVSFVRLSCFSCCHFEPCLL